MGFLPEKGLKGRSGQIPDERERDLHPRQDQLLSLLSLERCGGVLPQDDQGRQPGVQELVLR